MDIFSVEGPFIPDSTGTSRRREITMSTVEKQVYDQLWTAADIEKKGFIAGVDAVPFFEKTGLDPRTLGQIWGLADEDNEGVLDRPKFDIAVRLVAHAQGGRDPGPALIYAEPEVLAEDKRRYARIFLTAEPINGLLDGTKTREIMLKSRLPVDKLTQIWKLADTKSRGSLDIQEFSIAMFYMDQLLKGLITALPTTLPPAIYNIFKESIRDIPDW
ncbi:hypothetical protein BGX29_009039, partial [Mortierella sp. GBA35]